MATPGRSRQHCCWACSCSPLLHSLAHHNTLLLPCRAVAPALPSAYMRQAAQMTVNDRWLDVNEDSMQLSRTSSATLVRLRGKGVSQFQLAPAHLHFGDVPLAEVARQAAVIKNVSTERARFTVLHPQDRALRVAYKPGPLAAGMETPITIEFRPQVGSALSVCLP